MDRKALNITGVNPKLNNEYQRYLASDLWRCPDAIVNPDIPMQVKCNTGAHHWIGFKDGRTGEFYCHHCFVIRKFATNWNSMNPYQ